jgi:alpha-glucosidase (family GH31 glycosyl hydrolase)
MRWTQFGCFSPIMQMHRQVIKELQYPWRYGEEALQNYQFFARLHLRLFPYIYTYAREASRSGLPMIRPLVLTHQTDANTYSLKHTYLFGNEFLVAPMITPNASARQVYLPAGNWFDFWTNEQHAGGQTITWTNQQQARMPLFVREGAIVPMLLTEVQTLCDANYVNNPSVSTPDSGLLVLVYPSATSHFTVYDETDIRCEAGGGNLTVTLSSMARPMQLQLLADETAEVKRDGVALPRLNTGAQFEAAVTGWRVDQQARQIFVKFQHAGGTTKVTL